MSHLRAPAARADRREGGRHGRPVARTAPAPAETHIRPQLLRLAVLPPTAVALSACAVVLFTVRSTGVRPGATLWAVLAGAVAVTGVGIVIAAVAADRAARSVSDRIVALRRGTARGEAELRAVMEALRRGEVPPQRTARGGPPPDADDFELLAADLSRAHDGAVNAVVQASQLSSQAGSEQKLEVFVNLARRLQSLVHREISILDELENEIEDPDLLKGLFHVDHLATRIRRHAENLAVLGGAVSRRQWSNPVSMTEVLRSAIAEVEQYSRVKLVPPIDGELRGHAVADVIHLLAELVENATVFSAPHTQVLLRANLVTSGLAVEVEDRGLGMPVEEQARMNALLADPDQVNVGRLLADGRIGLFVVSQLARRHGIRVRLQNNIYGGVQAVLVVPQALLGPASVASGTTAEAADTDGAGLPLAPFAAPRPPLPPAPHPRPQAPTRGRLPGDMGAARGLARVPAAGDASLPPGPARPQGTGDAGRSLGSAAVPGTADAGRLAGSGQPRGAGDADRLADAGWSSGAGAGAVSRPQVSAQGRDARDVSRPQDSTRGRGAREAGRSSGLAEVPGALDAARPSGSDQAQGAVDKAETRTSAQMQSAVDRGETPGSAQGQGAVDWSGTPGSARVQGAVDRGETPGSAQGQGAVDWSEASGSARGGGVGGGALTGSAWGEGSSVAGDSGGGRTSGSGRAQMTYVSPEGASGTGRAAVVPQGRSVAAGGPVEAPTESGPGRPEAPHGTGSRPAPLPVRGARQTRANPAEAVPGIRQADRPVLEEHAGIVPTPRVGTVRGTMGKPQLPRRRAQEHIVPQLRGGPAPRQDAEQPVGHDPGLMAAFQRGIGLAEAQQSLEADDPGQPPYPRSHPSDALPPTPHPASDHAPPRIAEAYGAHDGLDLPGTEQSTARHDGSTPAG
ncbi:ATP-binding protein [Streptomyces sp. NY05-11A]|uniref:ATP-binding protein n=1 Tax=Streptomyces soliscabiei TaxID=588897 RepID=UPI0029B51025|nr:ATP-binding protein [Streptomyces sp. NY05-11A]MDX2674942.1 ATP-binding protein [Streptomyces sp. NY05-11A]